VLVSHIPIMVNEVLSCLQDLKIGVFFDGTLGAGGHARAILEAHPEIKKYIGCDKDPEALEIAKENLAPWSHKIELVHADFRKLDTYLQEKKIDSVDGFFFDLGVSSMQLDKGYKGFSFSREGPLDMRMDPTADLTAQEIVNVWPEQELGSLFRDLGEEPRWKRAAKAIVDARRKKQIATTTQLAEILSSALKTPLKGKWHPATLIFQALRMCVNKELDSIAEGISKAIQMLSKGGRIGVMSFHSLEDRIVKNIFKEASFQPKKRLPGQSPILRLLTKKPLTPAFMEVKKNRRSRSAKLRFAEKI
jgi:16S rRNA (cytosine1402-N4)-methyltransferase